MHIDVVPNRNSPSAVLLRESYREGGKVRKRRRDLVIAMIVARLTAPGSKLGTARALDPETATAA